MHTLIEIQKLRKQFGNLVAVDDISFQVDRGEVLGFLGPNGAGKSTTMKMITGFLTPSAGKIRIAGDDITANPLAAKRRLGYLPEGAPAYPDMTVWEFLRFIADVRELKGTLRQQRLDYVIQRVNLAQVLHQPIDTLSKGFKRRVGLAQAILHDPEVLILDEPTDGLDPNQKYEVRGLIREMAQEKVIVLSTHILEEVHAVCSRAIIIAQGRLVADGTPSELEAQSADYNAITLTVDAPSEQAENIRQTLTAIHGVEKLIILEEQAHQLRYQLLPKQRQTIVAEVSQTLREKQWSVSELHVDRGQLDSVFRQLTTAH
ncbi:ABC transporter ATP-binding protein [Thioflexithrix psekupsensis]|uniref:ABC transporter ATP-binding protein n=1 Tax=Thioflexithrix psekupsensis TaxID=1570016 RepID=A0A251X6T3_9GAMM|nr:ABC transporter ATP-binding protein [Thioflexithrix psekupsensis]OUD13307.1 ABC transporter ATP-binding protein [Thioflexithrix psekupsensis]